VPDSDPTLFELHPPTTRQGVQSAPYATVKSMAPASRDRDPLPSFTAAEKLHGTGMGSQQRLAVYHALRKTQGCTSAELAKAMGGDRYIPSRRLPELRAAGWACNGPRRVCRVTGIVSSTWWISRPWKGNPTAPAPVPHKPTSETADGTETHTTPLRQAHVLSPDEKRAMRERLAAAGNDAAKRLTQAMDGRPTR